MSDTFRFNSPITVRAQPSTKILRKRKAHFKPDLLPIAADRTSITDERGTRSIYTYKYRPDACYVTLTRQESDLIALANPGTQPPLVLEELQPWLPKQQFRKESAANWKAINYIFKRFRRDFIFAEDFCDTKWGKICNTLRRKTDYDARFYSAWHLPIQDAFVLEEVRPENVVLSIDYNSMYASCMQHEFPNPSSLHHIRLGRYSKKNENLPYGLYRCILHPPASDFIVKYNPFRTFFSGRYLGASIKEPLTVDLNEFEIKFFHNHFDRIEMVDAVISHDKVFHPLARDARRHYAKRKHFKNNNNKTLADREKFLLTLLSSCSHRPPKRRKSFALEKSASEHLNQTYGIIVDTGTLSDKSERWLNGQKNISVHKDWSGVTVFAPDLYDSSVCFQFTQRVVARSRVILLEMMERLTQAEMGIEICYANIDSLHFSLPKNYISEVLETLKMEASDQLGSFRIETITRCGLWLEPGRYWLYSDRLERFRNRGIGRGQNPFMDHSMHVAVKKIGDLHIPFKLNFSMDRSMSDARAITYCSDSGLYRQKIVELTSKQELNNILETLECNRKIYIPQRIRKFERLRSRRGLCSDPLPRDTAK